MCSLLKREDAVSMYLLNRSIPSSTKTFILLVLFLTPNTALYSDT